MKKMKEKECEKIAKKWFEEHPNACKGNWNFFEQEKESGNTAMVYGDRFFIVEYNMGRGANFIAVGNSEKFRIEV